MMLRASSQRNTIMFDDIDNMARIEREIEKKMEAASKRVQELAV